MARPGSGWGHRSDLPCGMPQVAVTHERKQTRFRSVQQHSILQDRAQAVKCKDRNVKRARRFTVSATNWREEIPHRWPSGRGIFSCWTIRERIRSPAASGSLHPSRVVLRDSCDPREPLALVPGPEVTGTWPVAFRRSFQPEQEHRKTGI